MSALKSILVATLVILASHAWGADTRHVEKMNWRPQRRGSPTRGQDRPPVDQAGLHVEVLPTAEPPPGVYDPNLPPRLQFVEVDSAGAVHQVRCAEAPPDPNRFRRLEIPCDVTLDPGGCDGIACDGYACGGACLPFLYWGTIDYLYWSLRGAQVPPLVTTSPRDTDREDAGVLGLSTTAVLVGNDRFGERGISGGRIEFGRWFPERGGVGLHVAFLGFQDAKDDALLSSNEAGLPILARPFFSVEPQAAGQNAELVSFPGELVGRVGVNAATSYEAAELMFRWLIDKQPNRRIQLLAGYQYMGLDDGLVIADFKRVIGGSGGLAIGTTLAEADLFGAENRFNGFAFGLLGSLRRSRATVDMGMKLALGNNRARIGINGSTTVSVPLPGGGAEVITRPGGLLTQGTNIGRYEDDSFAVAPELYLGGGYDLNAQTRVVLAYRFVYVSQVARAAEQVDLGVNLSQLDPDGLEGERRPRFDLKLTDFWAQGLSLGVDYRF